MFFQLVKDGPNLKPLVTGAWLLVSGHWMLVTGVLVAGYWSLSAHLKFAVTRSQPPEARDFKPVTRNQQQETRRLFRPEYLIPGIAQTGQNISNVIQFFINGGYPDFHIGMGGGQLFDTLRGSNHKNTFYLFTA